MEEYAEALRAAIAPSCEPVPDAPGVFVARLGTAQWVELDEFRQRDPGWRDRLVALAAVDANGRPLFSEAEAGELPSDAFDRIGSQAAALNGGSKPTPPSGPAVAVDAGEPLPDLTAFNAGRVPVLLGRLGEYDRKTYQRRYGRGNHGWRAGVFLATRSLVDPRGGRALRGADVWAADGGAILAVIERAARPNNFIQMHRAGGIAVAVVDGDNPHDRGGRRCRFTTGGTSEGGTAFTYSGSHNMEAGQRVPELPLARDEDAAVVVDLEATYHEAARRVYLG